VNGLIKTLRYVRKSAGWPAFAGQDNQFRDDHQGMCSAPPRESFRVNHKEEQMPDLEQSLATAADTLARFVAGPVQATTGAIETAVSRSFSAVENTIARAAIRGKASMDRLVAAILADFDRIAMTQFIVRPIENALTAIAGAVLPLGRARAVGGPVAAGTTYLVGEQGPELFTPATAGTIAPNAALGRGGITLNVTARDAASFLKSESQIAAMLARALARGQRNL
jgi:phage-related minor tail protein